MGLGGGKMLKAAYAFFMTATIVPELRWWCHQLSDTLMPMFGNPDLKLTFNKMAVEAIQEDAERMARRTMLEVGRPWRLVNEVRKERGEEPLEGGDELWVPQSMVPVEQVLEEGEQADEKEDQQDDMNDMTMQRFLTQKYSNQAA